MTLPDLTPEFDWNKVQRKCPRCGRDMVVRKNKDNGSRFFGCVGWPEDCQETMPISGYALSIAAGAPTLPGFD